MSDITISTEAATMALDLLRGAVTYGTPEAEAHVAELESALGIEPQPEEILGEQYGTQSGETKTPEDYAHLLPHDLVVEGSTEPQDG